jgi:hypothetical protein
LCLSFANIRFLELPILAIEIEVIGAVERATIALTTWFATFSELLTNGFSLG